MAQLQIVQQVNRAMECSSCGAAGFAACDCGAPYMPASARAAAAIAADPNKSDRAIAADLGVGSNTVRRARATAPSGAVDTRVGLDGKVRQMPRRSTKTKPEEIMPTEEEAYAEQEKHLYDHACELVELMARETRQKFFASLRRRYREEL